jgi:hypothetical protein
VASTCRSQHPRHNMSSRSVSWQRYLHDHVALCLEGCAVSHRQHLHCKGNNIVFFPPFIAPGAPACTRPATAACMHACMPTWVPHLAPFVGQAELLQQHGRARLVALVQCSVHLVQQQQPRPPARLRRLWATPSNITIHH